MLTKTLAHLVDLALKKFRFNLGPRQRQKPLLIVGTRCALAAQYWTWRWCRPLLTRTWTTRSPAQRRRARLLGSNKVLPVTTGRELARNQWQGSSWTTSLISTWSKENRLESLKHPANIHLYYYFFKICTIQITNASAKRITGKNKSDVHALMLSQKFPAFKLNK